MAEGKIGQVFLKTPLQSTENYVKIQFTSGLLPVSGIFAPRGFERNDDSMIKMVLSVLLVLCSLALIAIVMLQSGKSAGLSGSIAGGAETFLAKNKAKSLDAKLAKMTKWVAIGFMVLALLISLV